MRIINIFTLADQGKLQLTGALLDLYLARRAASENGLRLNAADEAYLLSELKLTFSEFIRYGAAADPVEIIQGRLPEDKGLGVLFAPWWAVPDDIGPLSDYGVTLPGFAAGDREFDTMREDGSCAVAWDEKARRFIDRPDREAVLKFLASR